jgi:transcriptional regulator with PAS, ATPase and Fis domain
MSVALCRAEVTMKTLFLKISDPSGHSRQVKLNQFPVALGTQLTQRLGLRDPKIAEGALLIEQRENAYVIKSQQAELSIGLGDLKLQALEIPFRVSLKVGDTSLIFSETELKEDVIAFPKGERQWFTSSESGEELLKSLKHASQTRLSIYLSGETGTGKEVLAKLAHLWSDRAAGAFVPINCGALALSLAESELFGHTKGSFTGAIRDRPGALLQAHGGTLFLDEVGDLPPELQVKLLRFLENGEIRAVGSDRVMFADVRIVCATHKPLAKLVQEGKFRQDLYFRLASIPIEIPSLRSRPEDIEALAVIFARDHRKTLTGDAIVKLKASQWPGNVRELRHAVERACGLAGIYEPVLHAKDFDFMTQQTQNVAELRNMALPGICSLKEMEKVMILRALKIVNGNRRDAAKVLGIARSTLFEMMKRHEIIGPKSNDYWLERLTSEV